MRPPRVRFTRKPSCVTRYVQPASEGPRHAQNTGYRGGVAVRLPLGRFLIVTRRADA